MEVRKFAAGRHRPKSLFSSAEESLCINRIRFVSKREDQKREQALRQHVHLEIKKKNLYSPASKDLVKGSACDTCHLDPNVASWGGVPTVSYCHGVTLKL